MSDSADPLLTRLADQGVISPSDASAIRSTLESDERTMDGEELAGQLVELSKLTPYQADTICAGELSELVIGSYVVLDLLGHGGMGHVYKARHRDMDRIVALKVLPQERVNSKSGLRRFQQEVKAAARLVHPNIVTAFDADISGGIPYLVMEYVQGQDLQAMLAESGPLDFDRAVNFILQTARGLEYAHRVGVIHRDIKPANLLLDEHGVIRILDMGVAQLRQATDADPDDTAPHQITRDGAVIGTTDFMSPEQASTPREADARSDIYSLGCTLYFLLTNSPLFDDESAVDRIIAHRQRPAPALRVKRPDLPRDLDDVFAHMVAKDPEERYQTVSHLIRDLEQLQLGGRPAQTKVRAAKRAEPKPEVEERETHRTPVLTFLLITILVMILAFSGFYYYDNFMPGRGSVKVYVEQRGATIVVVDSVGRPMVYGPTEDNLLELELPRGEYDLQISKPGFATRHRHIDLRPWQTASVSVSLDPHERGDDDVDSNGTEGIDVINDLLGDPKKPAEESHDPAREVGEGGAEIFKGPE